MKPAAFEYSAPVELDEALAILQEHGDEAKPLAGGQSLVPMMNLRMARFGQLVDLRRIGELRAISDEDGILVVGAMTTQTTIEHDEVVYRHSPLLREATGYIAHFQIRNRGTIGGSLAHADPAAEYCAVGLALDAELEIASSRGRRRLPVDELLSFAYVTTLMPDELLVAVRLPAWGPRSGFAIEEIARRRGDFALVGGAAAVALGPTGLIDRARVVLFGVEPRARRLAELEETLTGADPDALDVEAAADAATAALNPISDVQATAHYRRRMAGPLAAWVVRMALVRARENPDWAGGAR
jgi:aerobic carbon-monoxide dehydrogenase medium subunit